MDWAMTLGVPVVVCPYIKDFLEKTSTRTGHPSSRDWATSVELGGSFSNGLEPVSAIIDNAWKLRPNGIIHIGAMTLQESYLPPLLAVELMSSVSVSSLMAETLDVPFVYLTPGGQGDTPATQKGVQGMLSEDLVLDKQLIVQVNGVFGPNIENQVKRWVSSESLTVDDTRLVNPVTEDVLYGVLSEYATRGLIPWEKSVINVGGPTTTWYEFFIDAGITKALPWTDPYSHRLHREYRWEWPARKGLESIADAKEGLAEWYSAVHP